MRLSTSCYYDHHYDGETEKRVSRTVDYSRFKGIPSSLQHINSSIGTVMYDWVDVAELGVIMFLHCGRRMD